VPECRLAGAVLYSPPNNPSIAPATSAEVAGTMLVAPVA
jgi:hypothetical protein